MSTRGRKPGNLRRTLEGIFWILRTGSPWRYLPAEFGPWQSVYDRFNSWSKNGLWAWLLHAFQERLADLEYVMIDSTSIRVHQDASRAHRGQLVEAMGRSRGGLTTKLHMACDALGYPLAFIVTSGERGDATQAIGLLRHCLKQPSSCLMDGGYDSDAIREFIVQSSGAAVIPPNPSRASVLPFDKHLYKERHKAENLFQKLKRYRRISTRYEKSVVLFGAMVAMASVLIWLKC